MTLLKRYIAKTTISTIALVVLVLTGMQIFISFVNEVKALGHGSFGIWDLTWYVLLQTPYQVYLFFPIACVLGCLLGLGILASNSELIVMRAATASVGQITRIVLSSSLLLIIPVSILGETVVPVMLHYAENYKAIETSNGQGIRTPTGVWLKQGDRFIHIDRVSNSHLLKGVTQYMLSPQHQITQTSHADIAQYKNGEWELEQVRKSDLSLQGIQSTRSDRQPWSISFKPEFLKIAMTEPDEMNLWQLNKYIQAQSHNGVVVAIYELNFWQRIFQPIASCVMLLLAIPFVFGSVRLQSVGARILMGAVFGFSFHLLNQFFGAYSVLYLWPPLLAASMPTVIFSVITFIIYKYGNRLGLTQGL